MAGSEPRPGDCRRGGSVCGQRSDHQRPLQARRLQQLQRDHPGTDSESGGEQPEPGGPRHHKSMILQALDSCNIVRHNKYLLMNANTKTLLIMEEKLNPVLAMTRALQTRAVRDGDVCLSDIDRIMSAFIRLILITIVLFKYEELKQHELLQISL